MHKFKVFVGSATQDIDYAKKVGKLLQELGVDVMLWTDVDTFIPGKIIIKNLVSICQSVDAAVFIFGSTDELTFTDNFGKNVFVPRDNVLIEYGLFAAYLDFSRVHIVRYGGSKVASDLSGIIYTDYRNSVNLKSRLETWFHKNVVDAELIHPSPYRTYQNALLEQNQLRKRLEHHENELIKIAIRNNIDYKRITGDSVENELWKIAFIDEHFQKLIKAICQKYNQQELCDKFQTSGLEGFVTYLRYQHSTLPKILDRTLKMVVVGIMERSIEESAFYQLMNNLEKGIYLDLFDTMYSIELYWEEFSSFRKNFAG